MARGFWFSVIEICGLFPCGRFTPTIKAMTSKHLLSAIKFLIFVIVIGTPLFYLKASVYPYILSKTLFFQAAVEITFFLWLLLVAFDKRYRPKKTPLAIGLAVFILVLALSAAAGLDPARSFWSTYERMFGVFTIMHLAAFFLVLSSLYDELPWKKIFYASLGTGLVIDLLAVLQLRINNLLLEEPIGSRPGATFGNPTFLAGYLLFNIFLGVYLLLNTYKASRLANEKPTEINARFLRIFLPIFVLLTSAFNVFTLFLSETRGDILGFAMGALLLLLLFALWPPELKFTFLRKRGFYAIILTAVVVVSLGFWFTRSNQVWSRVPGLGRFQGISFTSAGLLPRIVAIRSAWRGFLDRPVFGWGWDNFNIVYNKYYDPRTLELSYQETRFDKPHNFFFEDLVSGGAPLALAHLALLSLFIFEAVKIRNKILGRVLIAAVAGYFVRSLFIFDTLGPALMLYLLMGLVDGQYFKEVTKAALLPATQPAEKDGIVKINSMAAALGIILALAVAYEINMPTAQASYYEFWGFTDIAHGRQRIGVEKFKKLFSFPSPYRWNFVRDFAATITQAYFYNQELIPKEDALLAIEEMEKVAKEHPLDAYNHYALVDMYNQISDIDPQRFLAGAEREAKIALELSPDRQEVYFSLAKTKAIKKDYASAIEVLKKALDLDPKVADAHFYYGLVSFAIGDYDTGYREIKIAVDTGRKWKNFYEPRTVAGFFADAGHLDEALNLYLVASSLAPDDLETKIKLGVAYYFAGNYPEAKKYLGAAGKKFNFKEGASYGELKPILEKLGLD